MLSSSDSSMTLSSLDSMLCVHTVCAGLINKVCCMWGDAQTSHTHTNQNKVSTFGSDCGPAINLEFPSVPHRSVLELMSLLIQWANMAWHTLIPEEQREKNKEDKMIYLTRNMQTNGFHRLDTMCLLAVLMAAAIAFTDFHMGDLEICIAVRMQKPAWTWAY